MKFKKLMLVTFLLLAILTIGSVSAVEDTNDTLTADNTGELSQDLDDEITSIDETSAQTDTGMLEAGSATYSNLSDEISESGSIKLKYKNYIYDEGATAITVSEDNKIIDGNGAVIDMNGSTIRAITVSAFSVTIKNLTIKNANYSGDGGAIYFNSSGTVINCNFNDNSGWNYGGAVYFKSAATLTNCNFTNNQATGVGGAVYFNNGGELTNCNFTNNAARYGGAIYLSLNYFAGDSNSTIANCTFINNSATSDAGEGGAIRCDGGNVTNCNFINNTAGGRGGAIYILSGSVENCNLINNNVTKFNGGAICFDGGGNVSNCNFTNNNAPNGRGGAVYFYYSKSYVKTSNFINNSAKFGGAIYMNSGSAENCNFTNNNAADDGGAIYFYSSGTVKKSYFKGNIANNYSDIYCGSELVLEDNTFINNTEPQANSTDVVDIANAKLTLSKTSFTYNAKVQKPTVTLSNGAVLKEGVDYTLQWSSTSPKNAGTYTVTVMGTGDYTGTAKATFVINKAANPLAVKAKTVQVKFSKLKKKTQTLALSKVVKFSKKGQGTLTYAKASGNKKITINKKTGKVTIKKGLKKGTYKVKVKIKAKGNANYKASAFKTVTFKIKVK